MRRENHDTRRLLRHSRTAWTLLAIAAVPFGLTKTAVVSLALALAAIELLETDIPEAIDGAWRGDL